MISNDVIAIIVTVTFSKILKNTIINHFSKL